MKGEIKYPLSMAAQVRQGAVAPGVSAAQYLAILRDSVDGSPGHQKYKTSTSLYTFERWLSARDRLDQPDFDISEELLLSIRNEMKTGGFRQRNGRWYGKATISNLQSSVIRLHNRAFGTDPRIRRELINLVTYRRYRYFNDLSETTRAALVWFELKATHASRGRGNARTLLTVTARNAGIDEAFALLRRFGIRGLEDITEERIAEFIGIPDANDPGYRTRVRELTFLRPVFRACCEQGLLSSNPLSDTPNDTFDSFATRDFLPPGELNRLLDLESLDKRDWRQLRDRLLCLLYVDTAMRLNELAGLELDQVRKCEDGTYEVWLWPENQKMGGKPSAMLPILYPQTQELLEAYLERIRPKFDCGGLIVNDLGQRASGTVCGKAVCREGTRLGLKSYYRHAPPTPHDLRRTFGTCNARPLGFNMGVEELAQRMRDGIEVVYKHYIVSNPLITRSRAQEYRKRFAAPIDPSLDDVDNSIAILGQAGISAEVLSLVRSQLQAKRQEPEIADVDENPEPATWIAEDAAFAIIEREWGTVPRPRSIRKFARQQGMARPGDHRGHLVYDEGAVLKLAGEHRPFPSDYDDGTSTQRGLRHRLSKVPTFSIGHHRLLKKDDLIRVLSHSRSAG
jgi:integrase